MFIPIFDSNKLDRIIHSSDDSQLKILDERTTVKV
jgi:hypothetical protein